MLIGTKSMWQNILPREKILSIFFYLSKQNDIFTRDVFFVLKSWVFIENIPHILDNIL